MAGNGEVERPDWWATDGDRRRDPRYYQIRSRHRVHALDIAVNRRGWRMWQRDADGF